MFRALLFDLDGTLVDTERQNAQSVQQALARHKRALSAEERDFIVGHGWREIYALLERNGPTGYTFDQLKHAATVEKIDLVGQQGLRVLAGAQEALTRFLGRLPVGVVTGSSREEAEFVLGQLGVLAQISCLVAAEDSHAGKPDPEGYLLAARCLGIPARSCLVVEDSQAGIQAAKRAGMCCVALEAANFAGHDQSEADWSLESLAGLDDALLVRLAQLIPADAPAGSGSGAEEEGP